MKSTKSPETNPQPKKTTNALSVAWKEGMLFEAATADGRTTLLDGDSRRALSPMDALLSSLCGCMAIDVVSILEKMRVPPRSLRIDASGRRRDEPPRYFTHLSLEFVVEGDTPRDKLERAVRLSFETYCSVFHTLRPDLEVEHTITLRKG